MSEHLVARGELRGHTGWVTAIATTDNNADLVVSASRDKSILVCSVGHSLTHRTTGDISTRGEDEQSFGVAKKSLTGHSHFVSDVVISVDGKFCLSGSWDSTLRLLGHSEW